MKCKVVNSTEELVSEVRSDLSLWHDGAVPWFRGEPKATSTPLIPEVFRVPHDENALLQGFRRKAATLSSIPTPPRGHTDEWLFMARHVGLPTRLLDWSESLLYALYFALLEGEKGSIVWMLDPLELNRRVSGHRQFGLAWHSPELNVTSWIRALLQPDRRASGIRSNYLRRLIAFLRTGRVGPNFANINIRGAWENDRVGTTMPVAIYPTSVHPRMAAQKGTFSIHRRSHPALSSILDRTGLICYEVASGSAAQMWEDLQVLGVTHTTVFPELESLARELGETF